MISARQIGMVHGTNFNCLSDRVRVYLVKPVYKTRMCAWLEILTALPKKNVVRPCTLLGLARRAHPPTIRAHPPTIRTLDSPRMEGLAPSDNVRPYCREAAVLRGARHAKRGGAACAGHNVRQWTRTASG